MDLTDAIRSLGGHIVRITSGRLPKLPWLTYGAIRFLKQSLPKETKVFEYGGGMSTLWYEERCKEVHTVEDNSVWYRQLVGRTRTAMVSHCTGRLYIEAIHAFPNEYFDMVVVDGNLDRQQCFHEAERHLKPDGFIVVDDSDKEQVGGGPIYELDQWLATAGVYTLQRLTWLGARLFLGERDHNRSS
ncbi:MAG: class I SAM-dependent methyltransferase [Bryobacteraceae bacterium]|jgi:hypothetical protein